MAALIAISFVLAGLAVMGFGLWYGLRLAPVAGATRRALPQRRAGEVIHGVTAEVVRPAALVSGPHKGISSAVAARVLPSGEETPRVLAAALRAGYPAVAAITGPAREPGNAGPDGHGGR